MFTKILIANRGEIACRIIRTAKKMGIRTVAVYSDADREAQHTLLADEAIHLGPSPSRESYLLGERVIAAALKTGAQAIHPGYGFLSENAEFCRLCGANNLVFIGPPVGAIEAMGSKSAAKNIMGDAGVPLVPGYHGEDQSRDVLRKTADDMGYPVLLKAAAGGGGKGMRQVHNAKEFDEALDAAKRESLNAFNDDVMLVEKYLTQPRHVEIQVFCDQYDNAVYLFERDCSVQRRHQKVIEEAPAPGMTEELRQQMGEAAVQAAKAIDYEGAGTVEFLLDVDGAFYFMEMNTRLQVEHPVTEMITGLDLVEWQLRVAAGEPLPLAQQELSITGHAFEARVYAEDPDNDFLPATGTLEFLQPPQQSANVRVDTGVVEGDEVSVFYDPMIAKLIVWDENRDKALKRLNRALREYRIGGVTTNTDFLYNLASSKAFVEADLNTGFIEKNHDQLFKKQTYDVHTVIPLAVLYFSLKQAQYAFNAAVSSDEPDSPWVQSNNWRLNLPASQQLSLQFEVDNRVDVVVEHCSGACDSYRVLWGENAVNVTGKLTADMLSAVIDGHRLQTTVLASDGVYKLYLENSLVHFNVVQPDLGDDTEGSEEGGFAAPINGVISAMLVEEGMSVAKGDTLLVLEAMKMEHAIKAPEAGKVIEFYCQAGDLVTGGMPLLAFENDED